MKRLILYIAGYLTVGLGLVGVLVPLLPTTPFLLLAAYCFSKSSPRMSAWLHNNPLFGRYLSNYAEGRGIPLSIKIASIILLWGAICFSGIVLIDLGWVRLLLLGVAAGVSTHILLVKSCPMKHKILILAATAAEIELFVALAPPEVRVEVVGVGPYRTAFQTQRLVNLHRPKWVILAGIAGAYPGADVAVGESVLVASERAADLGSFSGGEFQAKFTERIPCPYLPAESRFRTVESNSVSGAAAPFITPAGAQIENMEGVAFFHTCTQLGVPFLELRTLSNRVGEPFEAWDLPQARQNLSDSLVHLLHEIEH